MAATTKPKVRKPTTILKALETQARALGEVDLEVPDIPDFAGRVRAVEVKLQKMRRAWNEAAVIEAKDPESPHGPETLGGATEVSPFGKVTKPKVTGTLYRTVVNTKTDRSYNTGAIINQIADSKLVEDVDTPIEAIMWAVRMGLATLKWNWTPLQKAAKALGLPLRVVPHSIADDGDLDGPWVGEQKTETTTQEPIPQGGKDK